MSQGFKYTFLAAFFWAISIILSKYIYRLGENAYNVTFWSAFLAAPYWIFILRKEKKELITITKHDYLILFGIALISTVGTAITENLALKFGSAINYSFLIRTVILFTMFFAYLFLGEKLTLKKIILAVLILSGAYLLTSNGQVLKLTKGDIFTLIDAALIALGNNVFGKMATNRMSSNLSAAASILIGFFPITMIALINHAIALPKSLPLMLAITFFGLLITIFRYRGLKHASASYVTMIFSFTPVMVSFMALTLLNETMTPIQLLGGGLIVLAGIAVEKLKI